MFVEGPLAPWAAGMAERLTALGYTPRLVQRHVQWVGALSGFLDRRGLAAADVGPEVLEQFAATVRAKRNSRRPTASSLSWLVDYLGQMGVTTAPVAAGEPTGPQELIERYRDYLTVERGLDPGTIANYVPVVTGFLAVHGGKLERRVASPRVVYGRPGPIRP